MTLADSIQLLAGISTFLAVVVALFGRFIQGQIPVLRPRLKLALVPNYTVTRTLLSGDQSGEEDLRLSVYFHARVSNTRRRWAPAHHVQVFIIRQELPDASGSYQTVWASEVPVEWDFQKVKPLQMTIGYAQDVPVCSIVKEKWVAIHPLIKPYSLIRRWREPFKTAITFVAKSEEVDSEPLRIEIAWDGHWSDDVNQLTRQHLTVKELP